VVRKNSPTKRLSDEARAAKNAQIKATTKATKDRRSSMTARVFHLKIESNKLNNSQKGSLERMFLEAKWLRNAALADQDFDINYAKKNSYLVFVKTGFWLEQRPLNVLGSQIAQSVVQELRDNLKALKSAKNNGRKVGKLKFSKSVDSINLKQFKKTWDFDVEKNRIRIQGVSGWMRVRGIKQLPKEAEFSNAKLLRKADGYYLAVTCFTNPKTESFIPGTKVGLDMNVGRPIVVSNGTEYATQVKETDRLRRLQRKLSRQKKGSNNYVKTRKAIQKEYQKIDNRKADAANKIVHDLLKNEQVFMQDENLSSWKRKDSFANGSKKIHHGVLGKVKARLIIHPRVTVLGQNVPTTAWCRECHRTTKHDISKRSFDCAYCGYNHPDRDMASAENMVLIGTNLETYIVPMERRLEPVESGSSASYVEGHLVGNQMPGVCK